MSPVIWPGEGFKDNTAYIEIGSEDERLLVALRSDDTQKWIWRAATYFHEAAGIDEGRGDAGELNRWFANAETALRSLLVEPVEEEDDG